jgi:glycosyltransferase involved in cell wall biosynthesis
MGTAMAKHTLKMKLLILTQIVDRDDSNLGFFHRWIEEFAEHTEAVSVICLKEGDHFLPENVHVYSLGKEAGTSRLTRVYRFYKYIFKLRSEYDAVFVHMNPVYVVLGGYLWKRWHKKVALWYAHRSDTRKLRTALKWLSYVLTVSDDSFAIPTPKLRALGHGIDTALFKPQIKEESTLLRIATVGRVAASKHLLEMLGMLNELYDRKENFIFTVVGVPVSKTEEAYAKKLEDAIAKVPWAAQVRMVGPLPHAKLPEFLNTQDIFLNFSTTGNMDKAGLEALAAGVPLLSTNPQFEAMLAPFGLFVPGMQAKESADALLAYFERPDQPAVLATLRNKVVAGHSLERLVPKIIAILA